MRGAAVIDRAVRGSELVGLTREQKKRLVMLARAAYDRAGCREGQSFEDWRHEQQLEACGLSSLRVATQRDFRAIRGHFRAIAGDKVGAFRDFVTSETGDASFALAKLRHECEAAGDVIERPVEYVQSISRSRFKTSDLKSLSSKQVWGLVFDLRRAAQRRRKNGLNRR
ncbi:MAG TPA: hypothetical protein PKE26_11110 [Kiritimatiellia bacterium]|nr:hypothetical protein [Kiritimatiellia bacterium]